jgi:hypothetical protein
MLWFALGVLALLLTYGAIRARAVGPLFSDQHLIELAGKLPELKEAALASPSNRDGDAPAPSSVATGMLSVAYTISEDDGTWVHHLSVSSPVTPARAAGTFFLGLLRGELGLAGSRTEVFVTRTNVFHLVAYLSPEAHDAFVKRQPGAPDATRLRDLAIDGRGVLLPLLQERALPAAESS